MAGSLPRGQHSQTRSESLPLRAPLLADGLVDRLFVKALRHGRADDLHQGIRQLLQCSPFDFASRLTEIGVRKSGSALGGNGVRASLVRQRYFKSEARIPKHETSTNAESQMFETATGPVTLPFGAFVFAILTLFRISCFGIRAYGTLVEN